jgi:ATP-dependent DNA ligase
MAVGNKAGWISAEAINSDGKLILFSRRRKSFNTQFPLIVEALGDLPENTVIDGEVVCARRIRAVVEVLRLIEN